MQTSIAAICPSPTQKINEISLENSQQEYIYILLSQTGTRVSRFIQLFTRAPYNHASIAVDNTLCQLYSFCRNEVHKPLPATFNREQIGTGVFALHPHIPCEIYAVPVTPQCKENFLRCLDELKRNRSAYSYNLLGLCTTFFHIRWRRQYKMHCAEFTARMLEAAGVSLEKGASLYKPDDFRRLPAAKLLYHGELNTFRKHHPAITFLSA